MKNDIKTYFNDFKASSTSYSNDCSEFDKIEGLEDSSASSLID